MGGLLNQQIDPIAMGLLGAGGALMTPRAQGGGMGAAMQAFPQQMMQGQEMQRRMQAQAMQQQMLTDRAEMERKRFGMQEQEFGMRQQQVQSQQAAAAQKQKFTEDFISFAEQKDPALAILARVDLDGAISRAFPKQEWKTWFDAQGRQTQGYTAPGQAPTQVGGSERKMVGVNQGGQFSFVDAHEQTAPLPMSASPGELLSDARGRESNAISRGNLGVAQANLGLSRERLAIDRQGQAAAAKLGRIEKTDQGLVEIVQTPNGPVSRPVIGVDGRPIGANSQPMTESQAKALLFGERAADANKVLGDLAERGVERPGNLKATAETAASLVPFMGSRLEPVAGALTNWTQSAGQQRVERAQRDFINAILRRESGAVIAESEFENARKQYFPSPNDSDDVKKDKARARQLAIQGILAEVPGSRQGTVRNAATQAAQAATDALGRPPLDSFMGR